MLQILLEKIRGYKTVAFNVLIALATVLGGQEVVDALTTLGLSTDQAYQAIVGLITAANVLLRAITKSAIFKKR